MGGGKVVAVVMMDARSMSARLSPPAVKAPTFNTFLRETPAQLR